MYVVDNMGILNSLMHLKIVRFPQLPQKLTIINFYALNIFTKQIMKISKLSRCPHDLFLPYNIVQKVATSLHKIGKNFKKDQFNKNNLKLKQLHRQRKYIRVPNF